MVTKIERSLRKMLTSGESHGRGLCVTLVGVPAGLELDIDMVNAELARRQRGYGRGGRMKIEADCIDVLSGLRHGRTLGSPITLLIWNRDWASWQEDMSPGLTSGIETLRPPVRRPRPGHADLAGALKFGHRDLRDVLERASARETAARVAAGAVCKQLLALMGVAIRSQVLSIGEVVAQRGDLARQEVWEAVEASPVRCADPQAAERMCSAIDAAKEAGDSLGGRGEVVAFGVPPGLGSYATWQERLDARIAAAVMSIPSAKAVEIGEGWASANLPGSRVHDAIVPDDSRPWGTRRSTNRAGGIEGGVSNGEPIVVRVAFKPIPTLRKPLLSVDLDTGQPCEAHAERSDVCVVPAACVVAEAMMAIVLAEAALEKFGGDSVADFVGSWERYLERLREIGGRP
ncbi:MAG: chorismate synthase [Armatimonadetes bacterium]|nr:chorismate synthase [Armatimonadota bacterium]